MYLTRKIKLEDADMIPELDALRLASGKVWSDLVKSFWRVVRKKGIWLRKKYLQEQGLINPMKKSIGVVGVPRVSPLIGIRYKTGSRSCSSFSCDKTFLEANNV